MYRHGLYTYTKDVPPNTTAKAQKKISSCWGKSASPAAKFKYKGHL